MPRKKKKRPVPGALGWAFFALFVLLTTLAAFWVLRPVVKGPPTREETRPRPHRVAKTPHRITVREKRPLPPKAAGRKPLSSQKGRIAPAKPLLALIIDDMGQNPRLERRFFDLGLPLTFSFLPYAPFTKELATEAHRRGFEVMVHLPLEAENHLPTPGLLTLDMSEDQIKYLVRQELLAVPYAVGVNHHMGSLFTQDRKHVRWVLEVVKREGLYYVDSRTTKKTVVPEVARALALPFAERRVFLDHTLSEEEIQRALRRAVRLARKEGQVVVIGHPHPQTFHILKENRRWLSREVKLVPASRVVKHFSSRY